MFKYKVISEGEMTVLFPLEEDFLMVPLELVERRSIKYHEHNYRSYFTLRKENFLYKSLVNSRSPLKKGKKNLKPVGPSMSRYFPCQGIFTSTNMYHEGIKLYISMVMNISLSSKCLLLHVYF